MLAIIIPTLNSEDVLPGLLAQIADQVDRIVVADGGSDDRTLETAIRHDAVIAMGAAGRGGQLRRGAIWAENAQWLLFLHADSSLPSDWKYIVDRHCANYPERAGYFDLRFNSASWKARIVEAIVRLRCWAWGLPYGDQGLLISAQFYTDMGGFSDIPLFEDVDLIDRLGKRRIRRLGAKIETSADKYERDGFFRRGWRNLRRLRKYRKGVNPAELSRGYS